MMTTRVLHLSLLTLVACGGASAESRSADAPIASMPAYPAKTAGAAAEPAPAPKAKRDVRTICTGAADVKVSSNALSTVFDTSLATNDDKDDARRSESSSRSKAKTYSLADLQALERQSAWDELLAHAEDIAPAQRNAAWNKLVEHAAIEQVRALATKTGAFEGSWSSQALVKRYPQLAQSKPFMQARADTAKIAAEECLRESYRGQHCIDGMTDFLKTPNTTPEVAFEFGKIVRRHQNHYVAAPFFKWAIDRKSAAAKSDAWCSDEDLNLAVKAALGLPPDYEGAAAGRSIAAGACWAGMKDSIRSTLEQDESGYFRDNACAVLKAKGAL